MTDIYLHIVARMADYMDTHPYASLGVTVRTAVVVALIMVARTHSGRAYCMGGSRILVWYDRMIA